MEREEGNQLCREQRDGRLDACKSLGEGRYDPDFDPALFDDPRNPTNPNPYFTLTIGNRWEYRGGTEINTLEVLNGTKLIAGVRCIVVRDLVTKAGDLAEATDDWYARPRTRTSGIAARRSKTSRALTVTILGGQNSSVATPNSTSSFRSSSRSVSAPVIA